MIELDNDIKESSRIRKFNATDRLFRGLHTLNLYQNAMVLDKEGHFEFKSNLAYYRDRMNKFFDEMEEYSKSISLEGKERHLVEYALKLRDKANECTECGYPEEASDYARYQDDVVRFITGECKELNKHAIEDYERFMGKKYVSYPRRLHIAPTLAKEMYGDNLSALPYKQVIDNIFKLLSDLVVNDAIDTVVVHNDYGLGILVMIVVRLLKKDGYDLKVIRVEDVNNKEITSKQLQIDNKLKDLVSCIQMKDEGGYDTELVYSGLAKVDLRDVD